jgi:hypothetical protein
MDPITDDIYLPIAAERQGGGPSVFEPVDPYRTAPRPLDLEAQRFSADGLTGSRPKPALAEHDRPGELGAADGPRQLPPGQ